MGRGEATERYLIQTRESTDYDRRKLSRSDSPTIPPFKVSFIFLDRVQVFHRGCRDTKVRIASFRQTWRFAIGSSTLIFSFFPQSHQQVRMVLAMSQWGVVSISTRPATRVRAQVTEEGTGRGREGEYDQPGGVLRSRGASYCPT